MSLLLLRITNSGLGPAGAKKTSLLSISIPLKQRSQPKQLNSRQDGSRLPCCLHQLLTQALKHGISTWDSSDQSPLFQQSVVKCWRVCVDCSLSFLFSADRSDTWCALLHRLLVTCGYFGCCCLCWQLASARCVLFFCPETCSSLDIFYCLITGMVQTSAEPLDLTCTPACSNCRNLIGWWDVSY